MKHTRQWNHSKVSNSMKKTNEKRILFTSVGRRVELVQAFKEAAGSLSITLRIYGADLATTAPALSICDESIQTCRINDPNYIPSLLELCAQNSIDLLIPTIDTDLLLLAQNAKNFENIGTKVLISSERVINIANDKRNTYTFFKDANVNTPETVDDYTKYALGFPCFIKPLDGSGSKDAFSVKNAQELKEHSKRIDNYIVQNLIIGDEFTVDILCDFNGKPIYITPRKRTQVRAGEVIVTEIVDDPVVVEECVSILAKLKAIGPITIQYIKEEKSGSNYYIEINPRFGGGSPLSMKSGARSAETILRILNDETIEPRIDQQQGSAGDIYSRFDQSVLANPKIQIAHSYDEIHELLSAYDTVIFDLDDTICDEIDYITSGFKAIAELIPSVPDAYEQLIGYFSAGKPAIDEFLKTAGITDKGMKESCLNTYRNHTPTLTLKHNVRNLLMNLRQEGKKLGVITDGRPEGQHAKITSLNLKEYVDEIIITDELAGSSGNVLDFRKPNDIAFTIMRMRLGSTLDNMVYVGDNPAKDFQPSRSLGFDAIHFINPNGVYYKSKLATDEPCVTEETTTPTKNPSVKEKGEK